MSNYNTTLQSNNVDLQAILDSINNLPEMTDLPELTNEGSASDLLSGKQLIDSDGNIVTGTIVTKSATTYTPTISNQTIAAGTYCYGTQTIKGDANLKAENIAEGVSIFGVTGTHSGGSGGGSVDESAEILTFTFSGDGIYNSSDESINPFIEGMTWQEFIDSPLNYKRYNIAAGTTKYHGEGTYVCFLAASNLYVSTDGTSSGRVTVTDKIIATRYLAYAPSIGGQ